MANITGSTTTTFGASSVTTGVADVFVPELWSTKALEAVEFGGVIRRRVQDMSMYFPNVSYGDTFHIPRLSNMTAANKAASTDVSFEAIKNQARLAA